MNIHLMISTSNKLADKEIKKIVGKNNIVFLNMKNHSFNEFFEECAYNFFMDEKKYVVVKDGLNNLKENEEESLIKYLGKPNPNVTVIFLEEKVDSRKKLIKTIKKGYNIIDLSFDHKNIYGIINEYIKEKKFTYDYDLTKYLVAVYSLNIDLIFNELDKVFLYYGKPIMLNKNNVDGIISIPLNTNNFKFVDAVVTKNLELSMKLLEDLLVCKTEITALITLLAREYRLISYVKTYQKRNLNIKEISSNLKMQEWQIEKYYKNSLNYTNNEINDILKMLANYDMQIKTGALEKNSAIQLILINIIV